MVFFGVFEGGHFENCQPKDWFGGIFGVFDPFKGLKTPPFLHPEMRKGHPPFLTPLYIYIYSGGLFLSLGSWDSERISIQNLDLFSTFWGF